MGQDTHLLTARLLADGYCTVQDALPRGTIDALDGDLDPRFVTTPFCEGGFYGARTKRFGALLCRSAHAEALVRHRQIRDIVEAVLAPFCQRVVLNLTQAVELHPGALAQLPHRDDDLYGGPKGEVEYQVNVIWPLTPFTADNGATMIWPGSNRIGAAIDPGLQPGIAAEMEPGSALLWLGSALHGGGANVSDGVRRGVIVSDHLSGSNGREKHEGWVPKWMAFPPAAYTTRGGVGAVEKAAQVEAARQATDEMEPTEPDGGAASFASEPEADAQALAA